jgi:DNA repair exonuclease SbcCD nuclease subunit
MKISIMSDFHLGHHYGKELGEDSFGAAKEAIEKSLDSDLVLVLGDIFDTRNPRIDVWSRALDLFSEFSLNKSDIKLVDTIDKELKPLNKKFGIPVVSLHGNHERRGKGQTNIIKGLEKTGLLMYLHLNGLIFQKGKQKVAVQGMSSVPERYAKTIMDKWNPKPVKGCYNILMLHQSVDPFVYSPLDPPTLDTKNLPEGFDLILDGHIHTRNSAKIGNTKFLVVGSTHVTQLKEEEAKQPKGIQQLKLPENKLEFIKLENVRKFYFQEVRLSEKKVLRDQVSEEAKKIIDNKLDKKPILKIKVVGKKSDFIEKDLKQIEKSFSDKLIIKFSKKLEDNEDGQKSDIIKKVKDQKLSLEEIGMEMLKENLSKLDFKNSFDYELIFKLLLDSQLANSYNILLKKQSSLKSFGGKR